MILINRCNLFFLKGHFNRRVRRKIKWFEDDTIIHGMVYPCYQLLDRLYWKTKLTNVHFHFFILLYIAISFFLSVIFVSIYYIILLMEEDEVEEETYQPVIYPHKHVPFDSEAMKEMPECVNYIDESNYIVENPLNVTVDKFNPTSKTVLNKIAAKSLQIENAGGSSEISEAWSIHHLMKKCNCTNCVYEVNIEYWCKYKMMDYIISNKKERIGVSVVRAMPYFDEQCSEEYAFNLLNKKIMGLIISRRSVVKRYNFYRSILHIWSPNKEITDVLVKVINSKDFNSFDLQIIGTLDIWITQTSHSSIFDNIPTIELKKIGINGV